MAARRSGPGPGPGQPHRRTEPPPEPSEAGGVPGEVCVLRPRRRPAKGGVPGSNPSIEGRPPPPPTLHPAPVHRLKPRRGCPALARGGGEIQGAPSRGRCSALPPVSGEAATRGTRRAAAAGERRAGTGTAPGNATPQPGLSAPPHGDGGRVAAFVTARSGQRPGRGRLAGERDGPRAGGGAVEGAGRGGGAPAGARAAVSGLGLPAEAAESAGPSGGSSLFVRPLPNNGAALLKGAEPGVLLARPAASGSASQPCRGAPVLPGVPEECCRGGKEGGGTCAGRRCRPGPGEKHCPEVLGSRERNSLSWL
ncbi:translation initiation factor IF-2-like [Strigops habroptila]|uniref:translation initiation factor IF-2-like n=1 Tax=Strigops habroptila TaxID=2489341 RepID=UPI0011D02BEC|nr:translation initiation factor IF-2-like [Strigops habroptila]